MPLWSFALSLLPGLMLAAVGLAAIGTAGAALAWRLRLGQPRLDVLAWLFMSVHLLTCLVLVHGMAGFLGGGPLLASALLLGLAGGVVLARDPRARETFAAVARERLVIVRRRPRLAVLLLAVTAVVLVRQLVHVWLLPPYVWDTITYHLPRVAEWIQAGRFVPVDTPTARAHWPANHEMLQLWLMVFPRHDVALDAAGLPFQAAAATAVYAICRSLDVRRGIAAAAALAYACCPAVLIQATTGKNDLPIAAAFLFCVALLFDLRARPVAPLRHVGWMLLVLGLSFGTKPYIAFLAPGLVLLLLGCRPILLTRPLALVGEAWAACRRQPAAAAAGLISLALVSGYWYGRNYERFGDPFYPTNLQLFGELVFEGEKGRAQQNTASLDGLGRNLRMTFRRKVLDDRSAFTAELSDMAAWGWFVAGFGIPSLVLGLWRSAALRWLAAAFVVSLLVLLAWVAPDPWNLRFVLWWPALAAVAFAVVLSGQPAGRWRRAWCALAAAAMGLDIVGSLGGSLQSPQMWRAMAALPAEQRSTAELGHLVRYIDADFATALAVVPPSERIGYHTHRDGGVYALYGPDMSRRIVFVPIEPGAEIDRSMRDRGVRWLFVTHERAFTRERLQALAASGRLRQLGRNLFALPR